MPVRSKSTNKKRAKAENRIYEILHDLDESGANEKLYYEYLSSLSDTEFKTLMKNFATDTRRYHITLQINESEDNDSLDLNKTEKIAKKHGVKLKEFVFFPHRNPEDPEHPFVTATEVPIFVVYMRKMQQMLDVKNSVVGDIDVINPIVGQVTGESKAASLNDTQTTALATTNQTDAIREFLGPRADNMPAKMKMLSQIEKFGRVKYKDLDLQLRNSQSLATAQVYVTAALLKSQILTQEKINFNDEKGKEDYEFSTEAVTKQYTGIIIKESLSNISILKKTKILNLEITDDEKPEDRWHIYKVKITLDKIKLLSKYIIKEWYAHFWLDDELIVVYKDKIFHATISDEKTWEEAKEYGRKQNIIEEQLDFGLDIKKDREEIKKKQKLTNDYVTKRITFLTPKVIDDISRLIKENIKGVERTLYQANNIKEYNFILMAYDRLTPIGVLAATANVPYNENNQSDKLILQALPNEKTKTYLDAIGVNSQYRGQGIGEKLIKELMDNIKDEVIILSTAIIYNNTFYEKMGFHCMIEPKDQYNIYYVWHSNTNKFNKLKKIYTRDYE